MELSRAHSSPADDAGTFPGLVSSRPMTLRSAKYPNVLQES
uniref:Uncharacterized protein n=1 Tax=Anguilla anguilla TaxID=7936 RepID=A0A0E9U9R3_ANGAN